MTVFERVFAIIIGIEGGYSNDPADPGGETRFGISKRSHPDVDILNLTLEQAREIYLVEYWNPIRGDELPPPLALIVFDAAVNNGPSQAIRWLQQVIGVVQDGVFGPATLAAVMAKHGKGVQVISEFMARRLVMMASLPNWTHNALGWSRRLCHLPFVAMSMEQAS